MLRPGDIFDAASRYLRGHPEELARIVRSSFGLRFGVPLAAFRWMMEQLVEDVSALEPEITAVPPGLKIGVTLEKMETRIRFNATIYVDRIDVSSQKILVGIRLSGVSLKVLSEKKTVMSALINSGALDISQLGNLINELPGLPPVIEEAGGQRIVFDLMRSPRFDNMLVRNIVGLLSSLITVQGVETETDHLDVVLRALPRGSTAAVGAVRRHLVRPGWSRVRSFIGNGQSTALVQTI